MHIISLAIPIIAHVTKLRSAASLLQTDPQTVNVNSPPDIDMKDQKESLIVLPSETVKASCATHNTEIIEASLPVLPWELNDPKRNVDGQVYATGQALQSSNWTQLGLDIDGEADYDYFGYSVSLSSDGTVLAVGAPFNSPSSSLSAGHVRVYNFNGTGWTQLGLDIDGEVAGERFGWSVSLSGDGRVLAVGVPTSSGGTAGHVRVYHFNSTDWTQLGLDIVGEADNDYSGSSVSLSSNGSMLAVGAPGNDPSSGPFNAGHVRVYQFKDTGWTQLGLDIDGEATDDWSGSSVSLSRDGRVLAIGIWYSSPSGLTDARHVWVYNFNGTGWIQLGLGIDVEVAGNWSGFSVSLSGDGCLLAVGAYGSDPSSGHIDAGRVRVYEFNGTGWNQLGHDIDGEADYDYSGYSVSLSSDGSVLAVGTPNSDPSSQTDAGHVRVYIFNGIGWHQLGFDIHGEAYDLSGHSVSLSSDGSVLAVGAHGNNHVCVYRNEFLSMHNSSSSTPSKTPLASPTLSPSKPPSNAPSVSRKAPTTSPTTSPSMSISKNPIASPIAPSNHPANRPTASPTKSPTVSPSSSPAISPSKEPTSPPTVRPTERPSTSPAMSQSKSPTMSPSKGPSTPPTDSPNKSPVMAPIKPPTKIPTLVPTMFPSKKTTTSTTLRTTIIPSTSSTSSPSKHPAKSLSRAPSVRSTTSPHNKPPTAVPTDAETSLPTRKSRKTVKAYPKSGKTSKKHPKSGKTSKT